MDVLLALSKLSKQDLDTLQDFIAHGDEANQLDSRLSFGRGPDSQDVRDLPEVELHASKRRCSHPAADQFQAHSYHDHFPSSHFHSPRQSSDASHLHDTYSLGRHTQHHPPADYSTWRQAQDSYARQWSVDSAATAPSPVLSGFHPAETRREPPARRHTLSYWQSGPVYDTDMWGPFAKHGARGVDGFSSPSWPAEYFGAPKSEQAEQTMLPGRTSPPTPSRRDTHPSIATQRLHTPKPEPEDEEERHRRRKMRRTNPANGTSADDVDVAGKTEKMGPGDEQKRAKRDAEERGRRAKKEVGEGQRRAKREVKEEHKSKKEAGEDTEEPSGDEGSGEDSSRADEQSKKRLKNRQAAARCRYRRKQLISDLQQQVSGLVAVNDDLKAQVESLAARLRHYEATYGPPPQGDE